MPLRPAGSAFLSSHSKTDTFKPASLIISTISIFRNYAKTVERLGSKIPATAFMSLSLSFLHSPIPPCVSSQPPLSPLCYSSRPVMHQMQSCLQNIMRVPGGLLLLSLSITPAQRVSSANPTPPLPPAHNLDAVQRANRHHLPFK